MQQNVTLPRLTTRGVSAAIYMEKIVISPAEVAETQSPAEQPARLEPKLAPAIPRWAKWTLSPPVLFLPLLCLVAIVLRVAMRGLPAHLNHQSMPQKVFFDTQIIT